MKDDFEATFVVDLAPADVWETLVTRTLEGDPGSEGEVHYVLPGFPSFEALPLKGASCTLIEMEPGRLLRVKKDHHPCAGTEIAVRLEQADTGTRVTVVQSGFGPFLEFAGRDTVFGHGQQIVNDFRLYLERGLTVPGTVWGANLGARTKHTPIGLEIEAVDTDGCAETAGLRVGDLLLTLRGIRLHDTQQLGTVLALTEPGTTAEISWARGREAMSGKATF
jgi:uncharacterized protein YndB with AHSA1/START domain